MDDFTLTTLALEHLAEGVLLVDSAGVVIYANLQAKVLFGSGRDTLVGMPFSAPIRTDEPVEIVVPQIDGGEHFIEMQVVPLEANQDRLSLISLRDVTERQRAVESLRESEELYRSVIESAHDGFWVTDLSGCILEVNNAYLRMTGYRREDLIGSRANQVDVGSDASEAAVDARIAHLITHGSSLFETRHKTRDGGTIDVEVSISYSPIARGRMFVFLRDITPRKQAETAILAAKTSAERANRAKSEFLAAMSHDLRTPLNAIVGFAEVIRRETFGPLGSDRYREYVQGIEDSGALLVSLVNDVLDLSKIEAGKYELLNQSLELRSLMERSVAQTAIFRDGATANVVDVICPDDIHILGDDRALTQVFNNILSNAIKFNKDGSPIRFEAALGHENDPAQGLEIKIIDRGIGISEKDMGRLLKPFDVVDSMHARRHQGTGLGIYLSIEVMQLMGGCLRLQSQKDEGTTVTLWFPANRVVALGA